MIRDDDEAAERLLYRRGLLWYMCAVGAGLLGRGYPASAQERLACVVRPRQTEGPFFLDTGLNRSDIRSDPVTGAIRPGVRLRLTFRVSRLGSGGCVPLRDAHVELWHCDAAGVYSGAADGKPEADGPRYLRGYQVTDGSGAARFTTIYPGWYPGRTVHIHFMIRVGHGSSAREEFTSQLYFENALSDKVHALAPYASRGQRIVKNDMDSIYLRGGSQLMLAVREEGGGLNATIEVGVQSG